MVLTYNTQYVAWNGKVFGPLTRPDGIWTDGKYQWSDRGECLCRGHSHLDLRRVYTPPPASFATSA